MSEECLLFYMDCDSPPLKFKPGPDLIDSIPSGNPGSSVIFQVKYKFQHTRIYHVTGHPQAPVYISCPLSTLKLIITQASERPTATLKVSTGHTFRVTTIPRNLHLSELWREK